MTLIWMLLERLVGLHSTHIDKHPIYTNLIAIPAIVIYVFALLDKRKKAYQGTMAYQQAVVSGLIITILTPLNQYITSSFITPEYFPNAIQYAVENGKMTPEAAENFFHLKNYIIQGFMGAPIMGLLTTLIVAIFVRKK